MALAKAKVKGNAEARGVARAVARFAELPDEAGRKEINHIATRIAAVCFLRTGAATMLYHSAEGCPIVWKHNRCCRASCGRCRVSGGRCCRWASLLLGLHAGVDTNPGNICRLCLLLPDSET